MSNNIIEIKNLNISYSSNVLSVKNVNANIIKNEITAIMGPSGCGKSTLLRAINRMHDLYNNIKVDGQIFLNGTDIMKMQAIDVRRKIGMVFQHPNPFPNMSIAENVLAGYTLNGLHLNKHEKAEIIERCLKSVGLWEEVKDVQTKKGTFLSGGQQQRLCIARALALQPEVLLMDEPTSALDPIATARIEELLLELKKDVSIIIVTHNMGQAKRIAYNSMFMYLGELIEYGDTQKLFNNPMHEQTKSYLAGHVG
ncbi:MAG: phosphate ABC transporter ATP-binding protein [Bacteroidales bacterium]|nr:phosphate ABC transporter ATP-binding protein [Bacteroidales bacterium]